MSGIAAHPLIGRSDNCRAPIGGRVTCSDASVRHGTGRDSNRPGDAPRGRLTGESPVVVHRLG